MSVPLTAALLILPRSGRVTLDLTAAHAVPGTVAVTATDWGERIDGILPAGHILAAFAAAEDTALRHALAAARLTIDATVPVTELPDLPGLTLHMARGVLDPLWPLSATCTPDAAPDGPLPHRIAGALARAARAPVRVALSPAEANAALPQRPATAAALRLDTGADGALSLHMSLRRQALMRGDLSAPPLAIACAVDFDGQTHPMDLPPALIPSPDAPDPAAVALLELVLQDQAVTRGKDPLEARLASLPDAARPFLLALAPHWPGPLHGAPAEATGRLRRGAGLAAGPRAAVQVEVTVDLETGHVALPLCRIALPAATPGPMAAAVARGHGLALAEEAPADPATGALLAEGLTDFRLATPFTLPGIEIVTCPGPQHPDRQDDWIAALTAAAILTALRDATGQRPAHLPMTPDRVLSTVPAPKAGALPHPQENPC